MTVRQCFEACLVELDKVQAPSLLLEDFNYLLNKSIQKYFNRRYALFERNQQLTDDLRVLVRTQKLIGTTQTSDNSAGKSYTFNLPDNYVHLLNCICEFKVNTSNKCEETETIRIGANKLTSNEWSQIITNYYMRPSIKQPYYYISNISDPLQIVNPKPTWDTQGVRYGNAYVPILEIKCGDGNLQCIYIDYLIAPEHINLTQIQLDDIDDNTNVLEFPDYVVYEIINELVLTILENQKDPRVQSFPSTNSTISAPAQR